MRNRTFRIHVGKEQIRRIADPYGNRHDRWLALIRIGDMPSDLPLDVNPRQQDTGSRVSKQIQDTLINEPKVFHFLNRGMTIIAKSVENNNQRQELVMEIPEDTKDYGVLDGGHTYQVIRKNAQDRKKADAGTDPAFFNGHVNVEIMTGLSDELIVDIARARNTSAQVKGYSLANLENKFEWIKEALAGEPYANRIAYRENEDDNLFPIDVMEIVGFATMFHPAYADADNPPILAYSGKGRALEFFASEEAQAGYKSMAPVLKDVLKLYDFVHLHFVDMYESIGGFSGVRDKAAGSMKERKGVKLGQVKEVKQYPQGFELYYLGQRAEYRIPDGWLYPMIGALRALVDYKPVRSSWSVPPMEFFQKHGKKLVEMTLEAGNSIGRTPAAIGKSKSHWAALHDRVSLIKSRSS